MKIIKTILNNNFGQGFMEVIVAIGIMLMGIVAIMVLANYNIAASGISESRLLAANLAREGIEVIRNIRDSNWLAGNAWDAGLPYDPSVDSYYQIINFVPNATGGSYSLSPVGNDILNCGDDCRLYVTGHTYSHDNSGTTTGFSRNLEFRDICIADTNTVLSINSKCSSAEDRVGVSVISKVIWYSAKGNLEEIAVEDRLYDWR